jgi:hypothetical protein
MKPSLGVVLTAAAALSIPAVASAVEYEAFVACSLTKNPTPSQVCRLGDSPGAYFRADVETEYDVCLEFSSGKISCAEEQFAEAGTLYVNAVTVSAPGDYEVFWLVGGVEIASWPLRLELPPTPAPAPVAVLPPPLSVAAPLPSPACLKARKRIKQLKPQLQNANGQKQKAKIRTKLKAARATVKRAC